MAHYTADEIKRDLSRRHMLIRLHDDTSVSLLHAFGFTATEDEFARVGATAWKRRYQHLRRDKAWPGEDEQVESIVKHVTGGWPGWGNHIPSPWISTTASLDWAIYEIARRLVNPGIATDSVTLSLLTRREWYSPRYFGPKAIFVNPLKTLDTPNFTDRNYRRDIAAAINFAIASSEILIYGRIFAKDVLESRKWTLKSTGIAIPPEYSIPRNQRSGGNTGGWTDRLVWDPGKDSFPQALQKIQERRNQIY